MIEYYIKDSFLIGGKMKLLIYLNLLSILFIFNLSIAQTTHSISASGMDFNPSDLTITVNDTVKWTNDGGSHNVKADDNSFTSGSVSSSAWVFKHAFSTPGNFRYYCENHGGPNGSGMSGIIRVQPATDVNEKHNKLDYKLNQNFPNPFNPTTKIEYSIPDNTYVKLKVYNITGSLEKVLVSEFQPVGNYIVEFNASNLSSGVYFYQLIAGDFILTKRMTLLK